MSEGLRERTRRAVRAELAAIALDLFAENGFEETTVEEIARAAGLTKRSFFRYFPAKEDVVFEGIDVTGEQVVGDLLARPAGEAPWESLRAVLLETERQIHASGQAVAGLKLIESTPSLRARVHEKRSQWRQEVSKALRERPDTDLDAFTADLLTNAATAALDTASQAWLRSDGAADRIALLDRAFDLLRPERPLATPARPSDFPKPVPPHR